MSLDELFDDMIEKALDQLIEEIGPERVAQGLDERPDLMQGPIREAIDQVTPIMVESLKEAAPEMLEERRQGREAYSDMLADHWRLAFDLYEMHLRVAFEAGEDFVSKHAEDAQSDPVFFVLARLHARACRIAEEALVLMKAGYGQAAQTRWRALHEVTVVATFVGKHGSDVAERYLDHEGIESWKAMRNTKRRSSAWVDMSRIPKRRWRRARRNTTPLSIDTL